MAKRGRPITSRAKYVEHYKELGDLMFSNCVVPTVADFAKAFIDKDKTAKDKIDTITNYTKNGDDIEKSVTRRDDNYSEAESKKFMNSVIAANITDITESGYFWKKLISSCDDMTIEIDDCGGSGVEILLPVTEEFFNFKIRNHWVEELSKYVENYNDIPKRGSVHVRSFLSCNHGIRHFCKKCAGLYRRSYDTSFTPKNIGIYATYMITEHATQASLDSMNNGTAEKVNVILEGKITKVKDITDAKEKINEIIDTIGWSAGVESRFYEIALLSRWRDNKFVPMMTSFLKQPDLLGSFIYKPNKTTFNKLLSGSSFEANSMKTKVAFDKYD